MPLATLTAVHEHVAAALEQRVTRDEHWHGHRVLIPDGTGISMPDTPAMIRRELCLFAIAYNLVRALMQ